MRPLFFSTVLFFSAVAFAGGEEPLWIPGGEDAQRAVAKRNGKTQLSQLAKTLRPGSWAELKTDMPEDLWAAPPPSKRLHIGTWSDDAHWDSRTGQFLFFGVRQTRKFIAYSETTNAWRTIEFEGKDNAPELSQQFGHQYSNNALDAEKSRYYTGVYQYDVLADRWNKLPPAQPGRNTMVFEYFAAMRGLVSLARQPPGTVRFFSEEKQRWIGLGPVAIHGYHSMARHNPFRQEILLAGGNDSRNVTILSKDGTCSEKKKLPEPLTVRVGVVTVDPISGCYLILTSNRKFYEFDSRSNDYRLIDDYSNTPMPTAPNRASVVAFIPEYGVSMWADKKVFLYKHGASAE